MAIEVQELSKTYGDQKALDDLSFVIKTGEVVGFLGPNGAGKSTAMKILTGYLSATSGKVLIEKEVVAKGGIGFKKKIGYLPENNPLYVGMYVREYLRFCARIHAVPKDRIAKVIRQTGLTKEAHKKIEQLSKGYRQRVGLAAALVHDPEVLILDEPTTGLDPNQLIEIRNLIKNIGKTKTVLLSTHIMQEVEAVCDRVIILHKGKLVADESLGEFRGDKQQIIAVEFDYRIEEVLLKRLPQLQKIDRLTGTNLYELTFDTAEDRRPLVFDFAQENGLRILQMRQKLKRLEDFFRELTM